MSDKVKRGLGLLVLAVICAWFHFAFRGDVGETGVMVGVAATAGIAAAACALGGLAMLAVGLLRD
jgi:hypothetical protein